MYANPSRPKILLLLSTMCILVSACSQAPTAAPSSTAVPTSLERVASATIAPKPTSTLTAKPTSSMVPSAQPVTFPTEVYPDPVNRTGSGAVSFDWCPNPAGLEQVPDFPADAMIKLINELLSANMEMEKAVTDPAAWPLLDQYAYGSEQIDASWLDGAPQPASNSPYADVLAGQCGQSTINLSWTVTVCPEPCSANTSESLKQDYFFLTRAGTPLIWIVWP